MTKGEAIVFVLWMIVGSAVGFAATMVVIESWKGRRRAR